MHWVCRCAAWGRSTQTDLLMPDVDSWADSWPHTCISSHRSVSSYHLPLLVSSSSSSSSKSSSSPLICLFASLVYSFPSQLHTFLFILIPCLIFIFAPIVFLVRILISIVISLSTMAWQTQGERWLTITSCRALSRGDRGEE